MDGLEKILVESKSTTEALLESSKKRLSTDKYDILLSKLLEKNMDEVEDEFDIDDEIDSVVDGLNPEDLIGYDDEEAEQDYDDFFGDFDFSDHIDFDLDDLDFALNADEDELEDDDDELKESEILSEKLSKLGRIKLARSMKRRSAILSRKREISSKKRATREVLLKRAVIAAKNKVRNKLLKGRKYNELSVSEKEAIEKRLKTMQPVIKRLSQKMIAIVRKREADRLSSGK